MSHWVTPGVMGRAQTPALIVWPRPSQALACQTLQWGLWGPGDAPSLHTWHPAQEEHAPGDEAGTEGEQSGPTSSPQRPQQGSPELWLPCRQVGIMVKPSEPQDPVLPRHTWSPSSPNSPRRSPLSTPSFQAQPMAPALSLVTPQIHLPRPRPHRPLTWQQQDGGALGALGVLGLTAQPEVGAERPVQAQGAVGPGPRGAGGDPEGGIAAVPLQQPLPQPPVQGGGRPGAGGAAAEQSLGLPGAGGSQQPWGV